MSIVFHPGQVLTQNDLKISIRDSGSSLIDPYYIRYSLFDYTTGMEVLIGDADRVPATTGVGNFYVNAMVPLDANVGDWIVRWNFREAVSSPLVQVAQEFAVVKAEVVISITGDPNKDNFIRRLRILLRDNNPDRNYSVDGKEEVEIEADGVRYNVTIEDLYDTIQEGSYGNL